MPKYLAYGSYTVEGLQGLGKEGGTARREAVEQAVKSVGGTLEAYYFAFGHNDFFVIMDLPDNVTAAAGSIMTNAAGTSKVTYTVLITPEEIDQATDLVKKMAAAYRPPGQ